MYRCPLFVQTCKSFCWMKCQVKDAHPELKPNEILGKLAEFWKAESTVNRQIIHQSPILYRFECIPSWLNRLNFEICAGWKAWIWNRIQKIRHANVFVLWINLGFIAWLHWQRITATHNLSHKHILTVFAIKSYSIDRGFVHSWDICWREEDIR